MFWEQKIVKLTHLTCVQIKKLCPIDSWINRLVRKLNNLYGNRWVSLLKKQPIYKCDDNYS